MDLAMDSPQSTLNALDPSRTGAGLATGGTQARAGVAAGIPGTGKPAVAGDRVTLSPEATAQLAKLKARDASVRAHEAAHIASGGSLVTGSPSYSYQRGPDGASYAVDGEVAIDTTPVQGDPKATLEKARQIEAAALAPVDPSGQDQSVASQAAAMAASASAQLAAPGTGALVDVNG